MTNIHVQVHILKSTRYQCICVHIHIHVLLSPITDLSHDPFECSCESNCFWFSLNISKSLIVSCVITDTKDSIVWVCPWLWNIIYKLRIIQLVLKIFSQCWFFSFSLISSCSLKRVGPPRNKSGGDNNWIVKNYLTIGKQDNYATNTHKMNIHTDTVHENVLES